LQALGFEPRTSAYSSEEPFHHVKTLGIAARHLTW